MVQMSKRLTLRETPHCTKQCYLKNMTSWNSYSNTVRTRMPGTSMTRLHFMKLQKVEDPTSCNPYLAVVQIYGCLTTRETARCTWRYVPQNLASWNSYSRAVRTRMSGTCTTRPHLMRLQEAESSKSCNCYSAMVQSEIPSTTRKTHGTGQYALTS